jgi:hypothetical protein
MAIFASLPVSAQTMPSAPPLPRDVLARMYRTELGALFNSADLPKYFQAHDLIEQYFAAGSSRDREAVVAKIDAIGLDRPVIGRLIRLRMNWAALAPGVYFINEKVGPHDVRYFLGVPEGYDIARSWPLVVKLPTANAFLTQPPPDAQQVIAIYTQWIQDELSAHPDALVLMPLLNLDELYGPGPVGMNLVIQPILDAAGKVNINPSRVYLIGHSMAAHAVWNIAIHYPTYFAAINSLAGSAHDSWQRLRLGNLANTLCVIWHDAADDVVKVSESREIVQYLQKLDIGEDYVETDGLGHQPPPQIIENEYQKLRGRRRDLYPQQVYLQSNSPDTIYNRADWVQIYQPLFPGPQLKVQFSRGSQGMYLYQNSFRVVAQIVDRHTIRLDTHNVQMIRLYLNEQMVDLASPMTILCDGKTVFDGVIPQSTDEMLKDQLFLGRGWRYYTAVVDLDLSESSTTGPSTEPIHHNPIEYTTPDGEHKVFVPHDD